MVKTQKHSRRSVATRKQHRRRIGGGLDEIKELIDTPFGLVKVIHLLRANMEEEKRDNSQKKDSYEMVKFVYKNKLSKLKAADWYELIVMTHTTPSLNSPPKDQDIKKRIEDSESVLLEWLTLKRKKANKNYFLNKTKREKGQKKDEALEAFKEFFKFLKGYSEKKQQYKELVKKNADILKGMYGQTNNSLANVYKPANAKNFFMY